MSATLWWDGRKVLLKRNVVLLLWRDFHEHDVILHFWYLLLQVARLSLNVGEGDVGLCVFGG